VIIETPPRYCAASFVFNAPIGAVVVFMAPLIWCRTPRHS
jgi:hypothetical protein